MEQRFLLPPGFKVALVDSKGALFYSNNLLLRVNVAEGLKVEEVETELNFEEHNVSRTLDYLFVRESVKKGVRIYAINSEGKVAHVFEWGCNPKDQPLEAYCNGLCSVTPCPNVSIIVNPLMKEVLGWVKAKAVPLMRGFVGFAREVKVYDITKKMWFHVPISGKIEKVMAHLNSFVISTVNSSHVLYTFQYSDEVKEIDEFVMMAKVMPIDFWKNETLIVAGDALLVRDAMLKATFDLYKKHGLKGVKSAAILDRDLFVISDEERVILCDVWGVKKEWGFSGFVYTNKRGSFLIEVPKGTSSEYIFVNL